MTYYISIRSCGHLYGYGIRTGRNTTVASCKPIFASYEAAQAAAEASATKLVETDRLLGRRSRIVGGLKDA